MSSAASRIVRASKFRHVFAEPEKTDNCYSDLELSPVTGDHNYVKGNSKFFSVAVRGGGGPVLVLPYSATGKLPRGYPLVNGHSAPVYDMAWCPFNDNLLATGSDDATCKIWSIPDGGLTETIKEPVQTLAGHGKPVSLLSWHPTASNVIATVGKEPTVKIWDVEKASANITISGFEGLVQDFAFNSNGSLLATSDKGKSAKIHDPRSQTVVSEWKPHGGGKPFRLVWLGSSGNIATVGFTAQSKREVRVWDPRDLSKSLGVQELDQAAGVIMPFYDEDTRMLYLTGKGDGNIRYFEIVDSDPFIYFLAEHRTNVSTKGADMLPKRGLNAMRCEVARFLKLTTDSVEPISFIVPRKETTFQEDIFPETYAGIPSLTAADWFSGKTVDAPKKMSLDPAKRGTSSSTPVVSFVAAPAPAPVSNATSSSSSSSTPVAAAVTPKDNMGSPTPGNDAALQTALARATKAETQVATLTAEISGLKSQLATAKAASSGGNDELKKQLDDAKARIAELEASEAKLKKVIATLTA